MKIVFLERAVEDLICFKRYYTRIFLEGAAGARERYRKAFEAFEFNPYSGRPGDDECCEFVILRTPFIVVYRVSDARLEVLRVWDDRAERT
ncbi:type II toxin-antitoxin system RelE/ParE family toxin [Fulvimarina sp. MAC8]|uniref:type II toxin-antitoxin system RelE/ParE family toxin n=1 Tax=Fulvimarina sp. MAC8 TaxID=3162874 RepID=UPI0032EE669A